MAASSSTGLVVGLTGLNCAGKGAVADALVKKGFVFFSCSDAIRDHLPSIGLEETRLNMISTGNALRREHGPGALATRILGKIEKTESVRCVVDSIRNPAEVEALRAHPSFRLLQVTASEEVRFSRSMSRKRQGDTTDLATFRELEAAEASSSDPTSQQLHLVPPMADFRIDNSGDNLDDLAQRLAEVIAKMAAAVQRT